MEILITGGRGGLGRIVAEALTGHHVKIGTRHPVGSDDVAFDYADPVSIDRSVEQVEAIVHLATDPFRGKHERAGSARLFSAAAKAAIGNVVYVSIVGIDNHPYAYYRTKLAIEESLIESGASWTILRATQFHSLIPRFVDELSRSPFLPVPTRVRLQPIDQVLVADRTAMLALGPSAGRVADMGGPEVLPMEQMARDYLAAIGRKRALIPLPLWGGAVEAFRRGDVLTDHIVDGGRTYGEYLAGVTERER